MFGNLRKVRYICGMNNYTVIKLLKRLKGYMYCGDSSSPLESKVSR